MSSDEYLMPFVTASEDGPHEARSYAAGYEMGFLDAHLATLVTTAVLGVFPFPWNLWIHTENIPQADLIAMKNGLVVDFTEQGDWAIMSVEGFAEGP